MLADGNLELARHLSPQARWLRVERPSRFILLFEHDPFRNRFTPFGIIAPKARTPPLSGRGSLLSIFRNDHAAARAATRSVTPLARFGAVLMWVA
jgi:hypothetical protein